MKKYKVSCIIPVYNLESKVSKCIDSLLNQTLDEVEIILVNDCSTDKSIEVLNRYKKHKNIVIIDLKENLRQGGARNRGLHVANGEYVIFIDGDDWIEENALKELYSYAKAKDADIVDSDYYQDNESGKSEIRTSIPIELIGQNKKTLIVNSGRLWTKLIRKKILIDNNLFFIEHKKFEDNPYLPILIVYCKKIVKLNKPFYHYNYNSFSTSRKKNDYTVFDRLDTANYLIEQTKKRKIYKQYKDEYDYLFIQLFYVNSIITCITKFDKPPIKHIKKIYDDINLLLPEYRSNVYIAKSPKYIRIIVNAKKTFLIMLCKILSVINRLKINKIIIKEAKK